MTEDATQTTTHDGINNARLESAQAGGDTLLIYQATADLRSAMQNLRTVQVSHPGLDFSSEIMLLERLHDSLNRSRRELLTAKKTGNA